MAEPSSLLLATIRRIDRLTDRSGLIISLLSIPLVAGVGIEVIARYVFHEPTVWAYDTTYILYSAIFMLGSAYALHKGAHVRTDFLWDSYSARTKGIIDSISYILFFFPAFFLLGYIGLREAIYSYNIAEVLDQTAWRPLAWPFKSIVPLACLLLLIQGTSELLKSIYAARTGVELEHKEKVEV